MVALNKNWNQSTSAADTAPKHRKTPSDNNSFSTNRIRSLLRARYYDPHTAEFISTDPLEYVDGMSLFRGYFVVIGVDPFGRDLTMIFDPSSHERTPWGVWTMSRNVGQTLVDMSVECFCVECLGGEKEDGCLSLFRVEDCSVTLRQFILIDYGQINAGQELDGVYGHEIYHIRNNIYWTKIFASEAYGKLNLPTGFLFEDECYKTAKIFAEKLESDISDRFLALHLATLGHGPDEDDFTWGRDENGLPLIHPDGRPTLTGVYPSPMGIPPMSGIPDWALLPEWRPPRK